MLPAVLNRWFGRRGGEEVIAVSWNVAAINNNPWEYYMDPHPDGAYATLMVGLQEAMTGEGSGVKDVEVSSVFTKEMADSLFGRMRDVGFEYVDETSALWESSFGSRKMISEFLADGEIGSKRLCSMPDRVSNTLPGNLYRPTATNYYDGPVDIESWWPLWLAFVFDDDAKVYDRFKKIPRAKYPALTEEEEKISIPLQTLCLAVFDTVLLTILNELSPKWPSLKEQMVREMSPAAKTEKTIRLLKKEMTTASVLFLQEVGPSLHAFLENDLPRNYVLAAPPSKSSPQASAIVVDSSKFPPPYSKIVFDNVTCSEGDLVAVRDSNGVGLASFHGDTNGLMTLPVLRSALGYSIDIFGLDANAHTPEKSNGNKNLNVQDLVASIADEKDLGAVFGSCFGDRAPLISTFNARTFLQPQIQKAVKYDDRKTSKLTDRNPKDFLIFSKSRFSHASDTKLDNTGEGRFQEDLFIPSFTFPSDHSILKTTLTPRPPNSNECTTT